MEDRRIEGLTRFSIWISKEGLGFENIAIAAQ